MSAVVHQASTAQLLERLDSLASFNRHVAHDLRVPLVTVSGAAQQAQRALASGDLESASHLLCLLVGRAESVSKLLSDLLALAESDGPLVRAQVDLSELARSAIEDARLAAHAPVSAEVRLSPLPKAWGSPALLRQVFVNLIGNALKFSRHAETPTVEVGVCIANGEQAVYVKDNGVGFQSADRLFVPFSRLHGPKYPGHGIGLSFVKRVIERHGGRVWAEPGDAGGATFCFTLAGWVR
jgi:signal transduction histidine kinase